MPFFFCSSFFFLSLSDSFAGAFSCLTSFYLPDTGFADLGFFLSSESEEDEEREQEHVPDFEQQLELEELEEELFFLLDDFGLDSF